MNPRLLADENTSLRLVTACHPIDADFPIAPIAHWMKGADLSVKDRAVLMALRDAGLIGVGFDRASLPVHAARATREGLGHAGIVLFRRTVSVVAYGHQARLLTQFWMQAHGWHRADRVQSLPEPSTPPLRRFRQDASFLLIIRGFAFLPHMSEHQVPAGRDAPMGAANTSRHFSSSAFFWIRRWIQVVLLAGVFESGLQNAGFADTGTRPSAPAKPERPHYLLRLNLNEFMFLSLAEMDGMLNYGESGEFQIRLERVGTEVVWWVTINEPRFLELLRAFVGDRTMKVVQGMDPGNIDPNDQSALLAIKSLSKKLEVARKNPVWDPVQFSGKVVQEGTDWLLQSRQGNFKLVGDKLEELKTRTGKTIAADGFIKVSGQLEVTHFLDKRENTLEVFVMGLCPFAQQAESALYHHLSETNAHRPVHLELHFILYKQKQDGNEVFTSLHGEEELIEDLVQIVLRDRFATLLVPYVLQRATGDKAPWKTVAVTAGVPPQVVAEIESAITKERDSLLKAEYDYVFGQHQISDTSPTYVWEGERLPDIHRLEGFETLDTSSQQQCGQ